MSNVQDVEFKELNGAGQEIASEVVHGAEVQQKKAPRAEEVKAEEAAPAVPEEFYMSNNYALVVDPTDPIVQNPQLKTFMDKVKEYQDVQEDGTVLFPIQHDNLAYLLHLMFCIANTPIKLELLSIIPHEKDGANFQIQVAKLSSK